MINPRYNYDKKSTIPLNRLQQEMKRQVEQKIEDNTYIFEAVPCSICNGSNFEQMATKDRYGLYMPVVICKDCGLIQTNPRMTQDSYNSFYDTEYRPLYVGKEKPTEDFFNGQYYRGQRIWSYLVSVGVKLTSDMFVLEIGCGAGGILLFFREKGCRVKGLDLGSSYIEYGKKKYNLDLHVGTIDSHIRDKGDFPDLIIYSHVLEHVLEPHIELRKAASILSKHGIMHINVPGVKNLKRYKMDFLLLLQNAHTYHFTLTTLTNIAENNGFTIVAGDEEVCAIFLCNQQSAISNQQ